MSDGELNRLSGFSDTIRNSTLKRLRLVPEGAEDWSLRDGGMSFNDLAHHLIQCDRALLKIFESKSIGKNLGQAGQATAKGAEGLAGYIEELKSIKTMRSQFILDLMPEDFDVLIDAERIRGVERIPAGLLILETLDHETHHRGQMSVYLSAYEANTD